MTSTPARCRHPASWSGVLEGLLPLNKYSEAPQVRAKLGDRIRCWKAPQCLVQDWTSPVAPGHVRLVCVSDTHSSHTSVDVLPAGDILVHAGDFTDVGLPCDIEAFGSWLDAQTQFKAKVVIAGNHDLSLCRESYASNWKRFKHSKQHDTDALEARIHRSCIYLNHDAVDVCGLRIFGSPYQPEFYDWAFNLPRGEDTRNMWGSMIPVYETRPFDVLLTHGPPLGHGDHCIGSGAQGCWDLLDFVERFPPRVHIFGHIHEGYGVTSNGVTAFVNASTMNVRYEAEKPNRPVVLDVPLPENAEGVARFAATLKATVPSADA